MMFNHRADEKGRKVTGNGELNAMIDAEVNEGGPPLGNGESSSIAAPSATGESKASQEKPPCPAPNEVVRLPLRHDLHGAKSRTLLKTKGFEVTRLVVPAGKEILPHKSPAELTVQCLEGRVAFTHKGSTKELQEGDLLHLCPSEVHSVKALEDASLLLTLRLPLEAPLPTAS
jgi:quercetin dioxygenase-like cupin family protein